jgi:hypothetical protein
MLSVRAHLTKQNGSAAFFNGGANAYRTKSLAAYADHSGRICTRIDAYSNKSKASELRLTQPIDASTIRSTWEVGLYPNE